MKIWQICPPHLSDVATLPWEIQRSHFQQHILLIIMLSEKKTNCNPLAHPTWNITTLTCELQNFFIWLKVCCVLSNVGALKRASCGLSVALKITGCDVWQLECQTRDVTASVQSDHLLHGYMLAVFFDTDQSRSTPRCAEFQPTSQQAAAASLNMSISIHALL